MNTENFLIISNLAHHPDEDFYTNGLPWNEFRATAEKNLKNLTRFKKHEIEWTLLEAENLTKQQWETEVLNKTYDGIIISGSPWNTDDKKDWITRERKMITQLISQKNHAPILGVCFGHQLLAEIYGGEIQPLEKYWKGNVPLQTKTGEHYISYANHGQHIHSLPQNCEVLAEGPEKMAYIVKYESGVYGTQCHLERESECPLSEVFWKNFLKNLFGKPLHFQ